MLGDCCRMRFSRGGGDYVGMAKILRLDVGNSLSFALLWPSTPSPPSPHDHRSPAFVTARVCQSHQTAMSTCTPLNTSLPSTHAGTSMSYQSPRPNWP